LLIPQHDHAVVWIIHLSLLLVLLPGVEIILNVEHLILTVLVVDFVIFISRILCHWLQAFPNVAPILARYAWRNRVILDEHGSSQEHEGLLELFMEN